MNTTSKEVIKFNSETKEYTITNTIIDVLNQKEMFNRLKMKEKLLAGVLNNEANLKYKKMNKKKIFLEAGQKIDSEYKTQMPNVLRTKKDLIKELNGIREIIKDDELIQEKIKVFARISKEQQEKRLLAKKKEEEEIKKFNEEMNK